MKYLKHSCLLIVVFLFSCSNEDSVKPENEIAVVVSELLYFTFEVDEINKTLVLDYKIKFTNTSNVDAVGNVFVTLKNEGDTFTYTNSPSNDCNFIKAGESCVFHFIKVKDTILKLLGVDQVMYYL